MSTDDPTLFTTLKGHKDTITGLSFHPGLYILDLQILENN